MDTDDGGWTVFQRRKDASLDFYHTNWIDYEEGFGDLNGEFWLGLSKIHCLTQDGTDYALRVDLGDFENETCYAKYSTFNIGDSTTDYTITVGGYSGDAGDSLAFHNGLVIVLLHTVELGGTMHVIPLTSMVFILEDLMNLMLMGYSKSGIIGEDIITLLNSPR